MGKRKGAVEKVVDLGFYKHKKVFITGHTGFKGSWLCKILLQAGSEITGYALEPPTNPSLFNIAEVNQSIRSIIGDIRDLTSLTKAMADARPDIVIHMAAQPIVRESYKDPVNTYGTNVMGTVHVLEALRYCDSVKSFVNVTTDKVYENKEWYWGYRENDILCGFDPYSNSKSCSELVTYSYLNSFFNKEDATAISTVRSGNVIGGGDFAADRIMPDCIRAAAKNENVIVRNPHSIRPYQHVLDCLSGYLLIAQKQFEDKSSYQGSYNFGPNDSDCITTGQLVDLFCKAWGEDIKWENHWNNGPHEATFLKLDCSKAMAKLDWKPIWNINTAVMKTVDWAKCYIVEGDIVDCMDRQICEFFRGN